MFNKIPFLKSRTNRMPDIPCVPINDSVTEMRQANALATKQACIEKMLSRMATINDLTPSTGERADRYKAVLTEMYDEAYLTGMMDEKLAFKK